MKRNQSLKDSFGILIFLFVLLAAIISIVPVYKKVNLFVKSYIENLCQDLEDKTNLSVSYKNISPSILTGFKIKSIVLKDVISNNEVLNIKTAYLKYNILEVLFSKKNKPKFDLVVDGLIFDFNKQENVYVLEKILNLFSSDKTKNKNTQNSAEKKININVPINFYIKNVELTYSSKNNFYSLFFRKINISNFSDLRIDAKGNSILSFSKSKFKFKIDLSGLIKKDLEDSFVALKIINFTNGLVDIDRLNLLLNYKEDKFNLKTVYNQIPFFLNAIYDLNNKNAKIEFKTDNISVNDFVVNNKKNGLINKIKTSTLNIDFLLDYDIAQKSFDYKSNGFVNISKELINDNVKGQFNINGNNNILNINEFSFLGEKTDFNFIGDFTYKTLGLSGIFNLNKFTLKNGGVISTEIYFDKKDSGFMSFAPQLLLDDKALTALQLDFIPRKDSIDFNFELSDYSHLDYEQPGLLKFGGSYISDSGYFQSNLSSEGLFLDSLAQVADFFTSNNKSSYSFLNKYIFNGDLYLSSDLKSLSFNVPYAFIANTKKDNELIYLSLDGNDSSIQLTNLEYISNGSKINLSGQLENLKETKESFFTLNLNTPSVPYSLTGSIMSGVISVTGDYGLTFDLHTSKDGRMDGAFSFENLPVYAMETIFSFCADLGFSYSKQDGINVQVGRIEAFEGGTKFRFDPKIFLSGSVTKYGASFDKVVYSDFFSKLSGSLQSFWNINESFEKASLELNVKDELKKENVTISANVSTENTSFSIKELFVNAQIILNNFNLNRFTTENSENNSITATLIASGNLENPYIGLDVSNAQVAFAGNIINGKCSAYVEDKNLKIENFNLRYNQINVSNLIADFSLNNFIGKASCQINSNLLKKELIVPLEFNISDTVKEEGKLIPKQFVATLNSKNMTGSLLSKPVPLGITVLHSENKTSIFSSDGMGLFGNIYKNKDFSLSVQKNKPVFFKANGNFSSENFFISIEDILVNVPLLLENVNIDIVKIYEGILKGNVYFTGLISDPEMSGKIDCKDIDFTLPTIVPSHITVPNAELNFDHKEIKMPFVIGKIKKNYPIGAEVKFNFDRWSLSSLEASVKTIDNIYAPARVKLASLICDGYANIDLDLLLEDGYFDISGDVYLKDTNANIQTRNLAMPSSTSSNKKIRTNLNIYFGSHVRFAFDPILRCVFVPDSMFAFKYDRESNTFELDGDVQLRSGDIAYLNRNFYLKNGSLKFNSSDPSFNPLITVRAETRERDENGNEVRIILSADNQYLLNFKPLFSSIPAKSETEIRTLLGQIVLADSDDVSTFLLATGDYALHSTVGRAVENKLRDLLNFDILSVRTMVLQNALRYGLSNKKIDNDMTVGNFLDNSTVYIGKYFGSDIYIDALLHWSYDDTKIDDILTPGGLVFKPELGLELESPFGFIRWNMAPDINAFTNNRLASSTSVSLSWKISF